MRAFIVTWSYPIVVIAAGVIVLGGIACAGLMSFAAAA